MKKLAINLSMTVATLCVAFVLCEIFARALFKDSTNLLPRYHTAGHYDEVTLRRTRPNMQFTHTTPDGSWLFTTNKQGFRNYQDFDYKKAGNAVRVVAIGDSHTQGHEAHQDYTFSSVIERMLNSRGIKTEVLNTGVSGFSTAEALLLLERELVKYKPDYVVLGFFANDFEDNIKSGLFSLTDDQELLQQKNEHLPGVAIQDFIYAMPGVQWLGENSYFYSILFNQVWALYKSKLARSARNTIPMEFAVATKAGFSEYEVKLAKRLLEQIAKIAKTAGAEFILVDIPQVDGPNGTRPSVTNQMLSLGFGSPDYFVSSDILKPYQGAALFHRPNGGKHITEFTHTLIGSDVARYIQRVESVKAGH